MDQLGHNGTERHGHSRPRTFLFEGLNAARLTFIVEWPPRSDPFRFPE